MNLAELLTRTDLDVLDHLERQTTIPVVDGLQAQGDLLVIPLDMLNTVHPHHWADWRPVPAGGVELVRGVAGNNPHTLVADLGTCHWTPDVRDPFNLGIALVTNTATAYLVHPEHGANALAPGRWLVRRQQERGTGTRRNLLVAD
ncbi:hypothetical protein [Saccharothrix stipae]